MKNEKLDLKFQSPLHRWDKGLCFFLVSDWYWDRQAAKPRNRFFFLIVWINSYLLSNEIVSCWTFCRCLDFFVRYGQLVLVMSKKNPFTVGRISGATSAISIQGGGGKPITRIAGKFDSSIGRYEIPASGDHKEGRTSTATTVVVVDSKIPAKVSTVLIPPLPVESVVMQATGELKETRRIGPDGQVYVDYLSYNACNPSHAIRRPNEGIGNVTSLFGEAIVDIDTNAL